MTWADTYSGEWRFKAQSDAQPWGPPRRKPNLLDWLERPLGQLEVLWKPGLCMGGGSIPCIARGQDGEASALAPTGFSELPNRTPRPKLSESSVTELC